MIVFFGWNGVGESRMLHFFPRGKSTYIVLSEIQFKSKSNLSTNVVVKLKYTVKFSKWFTKGRIDCIAGSP